MPSPGEGPAPVDMARGARGGTGGKAGGRHGRGRAGEKRQGEAQRSKPNVVVLGREKRKVGESRERKGEKKRQREKRRKK